MPTNYIDFNGKTIRAAILAADNTLVGDIAKDSTLGTIADQQEAIIELQPCPDVQRGMSSLILTIKEKNEYSRQSRSE